MKLKYVLPTILALGLIMTTQSMAQGYVVPTRENVQKLLDELTICKRNIASGEKALVEMENNPNDYTLKTYLATKEYMKLAKECVKSNREKLAKLKKDYPGWFNSPSAFADLGIRWPEPREQNPPALLSVLRGLHNAVGGLLDRFDKMAEPNH